MMWQVATMIMLFATLTGCASRPTCATSDTNLVRCSEYIKVSDAKLYLLTRGSDRNAPILLWLHGGPGGPERPLFRYFNGVLENNFVVAYLDQRGAGRSFDPDADPHRLTVSQHLADLDTVVDHLRRTFHKNQIILVGHSWGGMLGLLYTKQHPEKITAFVGVAPLIASLKAQQAEYDFVSTEAAKRNEESVTERLQEIGPPPYQTHDSLLALESLADQYGVVFHTKPCKVCVVVKGMFAGLASFGDLMSIHRGVQTSLNEMTPELLKLDLNSTVSNTEVPVFFLLGRHDRHVDSKIAADYFEALHAPVKRLIWFENSAHNVPFEESELFNETVINTLQSIGIQRIRP
jgi:pimeloyl-ACP methyl ester carboxylesterase